MPIQTITSEEKARLTDSAVQLFKVRNPDFYPCQANSDKLVSFVESQLGRPLDEHPYPVLIDSWQAAYDHIVATSWFYARPEEEEVEDPAVARERNAQQKVRDDYDARQAAGKRERDRTISISQLGAEVSQQNARFREQRDRNVLPTRATGLESQPLANSKMGIVAQARINTSTAHPELAINSQEWNKNYAAELARLRG